MNRALVATAHLCHLGLEKYLIMLLHIVCPYFMNRASIMVISVALWKLILAEPPPSSSAWSNEAHSNPIVTIITQLEPETQSNSQH